VTELHAEPQQATASTANTTTSIEKYVLPYFGSKVLEEVTHTCVREFELWRDRQMTRKTKTSTLNNFTTAWNRVIAIAVERGFISERLPVPKLTAKEVKGKTRPGFSEDEIKHLLAFMETWQHEGVKSVEREMRPLLRDHVEMRLLTGMRHGTEAMGICWRHLEWLTDKGVRYRRIRVDGKTGGRWLIAKHRAVAVLKRLHARQRDIFDLSFETTFADGCPTSKLTATMAADRLA